MQTSGGNGLVGAVSSCLWCILTRESKSLDLKNEALQRITKRLFNDETRHSDDDEPLNGQEIRESSKILLYWRMISLQQ